MILRPARREDGPILAEIESRIAPHPWTEAMFRQELELGAELVCGWRGETLAGYGVARAMGGGAWDLLLLGVDRPYQGRGYGRSILTGLLARIWDQGGEEVILEVRAGNRAALGLYAALGFQQVGRRRDYYTQPEEDGVVMALRSSRT